jgi:hypothetical protein
MDEVTLIRFSPPLTCTMEMENGQQCDKPATVGQATYDERGFYRLAPICREHIEAMAKLYGGEP